MIAFRLTGNLQIDECIERVRDRYAADLRVGNARPLDEYLSGFHGTCRAVLERELLAVHRAHTSKPVYQYEPSSLNTSVAMTYDTGKSHGTRSRK